MLVPVCNGLISDSSGFPSCSTGWAYVDEQIYLGNWLASPTLPQAEEFFGAVIGLFALAIVFNMLYSILFKRG